MYQVVENRIHLKLNRRYLGSKRTYQTLTHAHFNELDFLLLGLNITHLIRPNSRKSAITLKDIVVVVV